MFADLHTHTMASDGQLKPAELVSLAIAESIAALAVTDHDTTAGLDEAILAGQEHGVMIVPGVELSTRIDDEEIHILGYFIDHRDEAFQAKLQALRTDRATRGKKIIEKLKDLGYVLDWGEIQCTAQGESIGRPHLARALKEKGYVATAEEAFQTLLRRGAPAYVPREKISPEQGIYLIKAARGVPVLAHPGLLADRSLVKQLIPLGLQGIEVYYPLHDELTTSYFLNLCGEFKLVATGGSDFHGSETAEKFRLGAAVVPIKTVQALRRIHQQL